MIATAADPVRRTANTFFIVDTMVDTEFAVIEVRNSDDLSVDFRAKGN